MVNSLSTLQRDGLPHFDQECGLGMGSGIGSGMESGIGSGIGSGIRIPPPRARRAVAGRPLAAAREAAARSGRTPKAKRQWEITLGWL